MWSLVAHCRAKPSGPNNQLVIVAKTLLHSPIPVPPFYLNDKDVLVMNVAEILLN
jgi:hypothetical protein